MGLKNKDKDDPIRKILLSKKTDKTSEVLLHDYMVYLRLEYDDLCKTPDITPKQLAYRKVCSDGFDTLTYGICQSKLDFLFRCIENYRQEKTL